MLLNRVLVLYKGGGTSKETVTSQTQSVINANARDAYQRSVGRKEIWVMCTSMITSNLIVYEELMMFFP